jgi:uncharacterized membrane protein
MNKEQFLSSLEDRFNGLSKEDIAERLAFYSEAIDDRMEDGLTEEEALAQLGSVDSIAAQIVNDAERQRPVKEKRRMGALEIVLLILGSPIWISLAAAAFSVAVSVYATLWACIGSFWGCFAAIIASAVAMVFYSGMFLTIKVPLALALLAAAFVLAGLSIFTFFGCKWATIGMVKLTKLIAVWTKKNFFTGKGGATNE